MCYLGLLFCDLFVIYASRFDFDLVGVCTTAFCVVELLVGLLWVLFDCVLLVGVFVRCCIIVG